MATAQPDMTDKQFTYLKGLYRMYATVARPLIIEIESVYEEFPSQVLNEVRAFNDHVVRCFQAGAGEKFIDGQLDKACGHVDRLIYDCYKFLIVRAFDDVQAFDRDMKHLDLTVVDGGRFYVDYHRLRKAAVNAVKVAKTLESGGQAAKADVCKKYEAAYAAYGAVLRHIEGHLDAVLQAPREN